MTRPGFGVMIKWLRGNEDTVKAIQSVLGKEITDITMVHEDPEFLRISFTDGTKIRVWDDGQDCCEHRYMTSDDELPYFVGATLMKIEVADGPTVETDYEFHEIQFLIITTSKGSFTLETHNEHNGYYGGFAVEARIEEGEYND
ncbi:MAG: hypothetical protein M0R06_01380 [Sphaerochaeta sp.]|jgi:hypothetical protein|nr:hypothetical protein [Sphaerochaeta sp.]